jgi:uncharacterized membrane protein required for colicin V production
MLFSRTMIFYIILGSYFSIIRSLQFFSKNNLCVLDFLLKKYFSFFNLKISHLEKLQQNFFLELSTTINKKLKQFLETNINGLV